MTTNALPIAAFLAAAAAFFLVPVSALAASLALSMPGILAVLVADYGRNLGPARVQSRLVPFDAPGRPSADLREAA